MDIFRVESKSVVYDEDDSMVIIAFCEKRALEIAKENWTFRDGRKHDEFTVIKLNLLEEQIVDISHYGD